MKNIYENKHYKLLLILPVITIIIATFFVFTIKFGIDLSGGVLITAPLDHAVDAAGLTAKLSTDPQFSLEGLSVRTTSGIGGGLYIQFLGEKTILSAQSKLEAGDYPGAIIDLKKFTGDLNATGELKDQADLYFSKARETFKNDIVALLAQETGTPTSAFSIQDIGPSLGSVFLSQAENALIFAFVLIVLLVFFFFRNPLISFAVTQSAFFDVYLGAAALGAFNIPLSLATIAPLLMLIGYSVDSDIMLTDRVLKRKEGTPTLRAKGAIRTGMTMTLTTIGALTAMFLVSTFTNITILSNISVVLLAGLVGDLIATWCTNAVLVLWFIERKEKKHAK